MSPALPTPRGPLSSALVATLADGEHLPADLPLDVADPLTDDDLHLTLWCCYELHHHGFAGVADDREWDPDVLRLRHRLEAAFERTLRDEHRPGSIPADPAVALRVVTEWAGPPLSSTIAREGSREHLREFAIHRSAYQLKEADGHTWGLPRLSGPGRSAMLEIQADEYGEGRPGDAHAELFAAAMRELGLDDAFGAYLDRLPGTTLATDNLLSLFGLNRRLRGALVGHLALFEMTSVVPMSRYLAAARRLGDAPSLERFYEVHVEADTHHGALAQEMVAAFAAHDPSLVPEMIFGAAALAKVEGRFAGHLLQAWGDGRSSLRPSLEESLQLPDGADQVSVEPIAVDRGRRPNPRRDAAPTG